MKFAKYIKEERLNSQDKRTLLKLISDPKKTSFVLKSFTKNYSEDEREVDVSVIKNGLQFVYNSDHIELTNVLVDIVDRDENLEFKVDSERQTNTTYFMVIKK